MVGAETEIDGAVHRRQFEIKDAGKAVGVGLQVKGRDGVETMIANGAV